MKKIIRNILLVINLFVGFLLIFGSYSAYFHTRIGTLVELLFPAWLLGNLAFIPLWLLYSPRYIGLPVALLLLSWNGIRRYCPIHGIEPQETNLPGFSLMSYNTYFFVDYEQSDTKQNRTVSNILAQDPDLVCLQESPLIEARSWYKITPAQADSIHDRYPYRISNSQALSFMSKYPAQMIFDTAYSESSSMAIYQVEIGERTITIVNQHMESIGLTETDKELYHEITAHPNTNQLDEIRANLLRKIMNAAEERRRQADITAQKIAQISGDIIVCGDFNDSPLSYPVRRFLDMDFHDAYYELGCGPGITYHANRCWFRIDHILYKGEIKGQWLTRMRVKSSDHYPITTRFTWEHPSKNNH